MTIEEILEREEGCILHAYQDHLGFWTIGIGTLIDRRGGGISRRAALFMMHEELQRIEADLDAKVPWWRELSDGRRSVLMSMAYQLGIGGLMKFKRTLARIEAGDYDGAADAMMDSKWASQTPARAKRTATAMRNGEWVV